MWLSKDCKEVKTHQVVKNRGHHCGDVELTGYLSNVTGPVSLVLHLRITQRKVGLALAKTAALRITHNLDGVSIISKSHTHPSHSQTSRLLTLSLSLGIPVSRATQCI